MCHLRFRLRAPAILLLGLLALSARATIEETNVNFDFVRDIARREAAAPYRPSEQDLPPRLAALTYDEYRSIRFQPSESLWRKEKLPFELQFFHRGGLFRERVTLHEFSGSHEQVIPFLREFFSYDGVKDLPVLHSSLGYAGFRVHAPLNRPDIYDEVIVFLGSSYFRAIGAGQVYGLSARGLAIDSGIPGKREEFPRFTEFWIGKPVPGDTALTLYALLRSPAATGAYEFVIRPGKATVIDVHAELTFRHNVEVPGYAPLTSMFWYGENSVRPSGHVRPEVHDSDGLIVDDDSRRRIWRTLNNPREIRTTDVSVSKLVRFGLLQRDRRMSSYEDLEVHYEKRPSAWIEPRGDWNGVVRLVELPDPAEHGDNIVAFWIPREKPVPGRPVDLKYRMVWSLNDPPNGGMARVVNTFEGDLPDGATGRLFWIDFADEKNSGRDLAAAQPVVELRGNCRIRRYAVIPYPEIHGCRVALEIAGVPKGESVTLRCHLQSKAEPISETWSYLWTP